jgi:hypothetical protein
MSLRPPQVHPEEHVGPVGRLRPARTGADREHRALGVVLAGEQQQRALALELGAQRLRLAVDVSRGVRVGRVGEQIEQLDQVIGPLLEGSPERDLLAQALRLAQDLLRPALVVPEPGLARATVEIA